MKQKNNIRMVVQGRTESAAEFANTLEKYCEELVEEFGDRMHMPPMIFPTSDAQGRQTATIQFITSGEVTGSELTDQLFDLAKEQFPNTMDRLKD